MLCHVEASFSNENNNVVESSKFGTQIEDVSNKDHVTSNDEEMDIVKDAYMVNLEMGKVNRLLNGDSCYESENIAANDEVSNDHEAVLFCESKIYQDDDTQGADLEDQSEIAFQNDGIHY